MGKIGHLPTMPNRTKRGPRAYFIEQTMQICFSIDFGLV